MNELLTDVSSSVVIASSTSVENQLALHAAQSFGQAHGAITCLTQPYYDSGGVLVASSVLQIPNGQTFAYVPCNVVTGGSINTGNPGGLGSNPTSLDYTTTSSNSLVSGDVNSFNANTAAIAAQSSALAAHIALTYEQEHQLVSITPRDTFNSVGSKVGRYLVQIFVKGVAYNLVGDPNPSGPPQPPVISLTTPTTVSVSERSPNYGQDAAYTFSAVLNSGTQPIIYQWQGSQTNLPDPATWFDILPSSVSGNQPTTTTASINIPWWGTNGSIEYNQASASTLSFSITKANIVQGVSDFFGGYAGASAYAWIRLKASNAAIGGGVTYSHGILYLVTVQDGTWMCNEIHNVRPLSEAEYAMLRKLDRHLLATDGQPARFLRAYHEIGQELVARMNRSRVDWMLWAHRLDEVLESIAQDHLMRAYESYCTMVREAISVYWPTCERPEFVELQASH